MYVRFQFNAIMIIIIFFVAFAQHIRHVGGRHGVELVEIQFNSIRDAVSSGIYANSQRITHSQTSPLGTP
jgi:hypothetical protein